MRGYLAFAQKELWEQWKNKKAMVLLVIFGLLGVLSPLLAKLMPLMVEQFSVEGMTIQIAEPTALDSWVQFYKNVGQMGLVVVIILFSGILTMELQSGYLIPLLTKGLGRTAVILAKFTMLTVYWLGSLWISFWVTYTYTAYYWDTDTVQHPFLAVWMLWLFGEMLIVIQLFFNTVAKSGVTALLMTGMVVCILFLLNIAPSMQSYLPLMLAVKNVSLLTGEVSVNAFFWPVLESVIIIGVALTGAVLIFHKKRV